MDQKKGNSPSYLFTIRVWSEKLKDGLLEWRGNVREVSRDEGHYFRGWDGLAELLKNLVSDVEEESQKQLEE